MQKVKFIRGACGKPFFLPYTAGMEATIPTEQAAKLIELNIAVAVATPVKKKATSKKK